MTILGESNLFRQVLQNKLIGDLPNHLEAARDELDLVWDKEVPECEGEISSRQRFLTVANVARRLD